MAATADTSITGAGVTARLSTAADLPVLTKIIVHAFHDDPTTRWIVPEEVRRRAVGPVIFGPYVEAIQRLGDTWMTEDGSAAALWIPPGHTVPAPEEAEAFQQQVAEVLREDELERLGALAAVMDANLPHEPHTHINLFGTVPERQGQGLGAALFQAVLPRFDRDGTPAYLEATSERNRRFYGRHGFVHWNDVAPEGGPVLHRMWRAPRSAR